MASLILKDDSEKLNPMWNPTRLAREAGKEGRMSGATGSFRLRRRIRSNF